jgi:hypothetical protein
MKEVNDGNTDSNSVTMTRLAPERRREGSVEVVDVRETREPPRIQLVKETSTFLSFLRVKGIFAMGERDSRRQDFQWWMRCDCKRSLGGLQAWCLRLVAQGSEVRKQLK